MSAHEPSLEIVPASLPLPGPPSCQDDDEGSVHLRTHRTVLAISLTIVLASLLLHVTGNGSGLALPGGGANAVPGMCLSRALLHMDCPGCGLTRSFVATAHGDLAEAFRLHRLGPLLFAFLLLQLPLRTYALARRIARPFGPESVLGGRALGLAIMAALLANWAVNLATGAAFH